MRTVEYRLRVQDNDGKWWIWGRYETWNWPRRSKTPATATPPSRLTPYSSRARPHFGHEIGRGCGFDVDFPGYGYQGSYLVWGSARDQVDGFGNAVSPQVGRWIGERLHKVLHEDLAS
jgi:site-specific DNA-cytosine methylase